LIVACDSVTTVRKIVCTHQPWSNIAADFHPETSMPSAYSRSRSRSSRNIPKFTEDTTNSKPSRFSHAAVHP